MYRFISIIISINGFITMNMVLLTNELHQLTGRVDDKTEREERQIDQPLPPALLPWQHYSHWTPEEGSSDHP